VKNKKKRLAVLAAARTKTTQTKGEEQRHIRLQTYDNEENNKFKMKVTNKKILGAKICHSENKEICG